MKTSPRLARIVASLAAAAALCIAAPVFGQPAETPQKEAKGKPDKADKGKPDKEAKGKADKEAKDAKGKPDKADKDAKADKGKPDEADEAKADKDAKGKPDKADKEAKGKPDKDDKDDKDDKEAKGKPDKAADGAPDEATDGESGDHPSSTAAKIAAEQRKHLERMARIDRLEAIGSEQSDEKLREKAEMLRTKEIRRHEKRMAKLASRQDPAGATADNRAPRGKADEAPKGGKDDDSEPAVETPDL